MRTGVVLLVYVDDILIMEKPTREAKKHFAELYEIKDLGETRYYLGIEIVKDRKLKTISLSRVKYIKQDVPYRELVGCLMFIATRTRPDIMYAVRGFPAHL
ncbi:hypothetical protein NDN08_000128 [Rhodosorus marinus]|uniref:Reverse transcriptase Ty1/copia-type domain-containing protein n=1 Tax=Rhodosorus marinus TaxID=101924 RepID=A0AAV8UEA3_9RHOD|nr:hypothetical protein NDN08_000128 [Rhodosorus marinus]